MKFSTAAAALALITSGATLTNAADWFRWRGPDLNGIFKETGWQARWPESGPKPLWKASVGTGFSSFSVSRERVYTMGNSNDTDTVYCLDAQSGNIGWKHSYACPLDPKNFEGGPAATPTVDGDYIYTFSRKGDAYCLDAADGKVVWSKNLNRDLGAEIPTWGSASSVLVKGDLAILNAGDAGVALDKQSGKVIWSSGKGPGGYATAVPLGTERDGGLAIFSRQSLVAVKVADGRELWRYPWKTEYDVNAADPVIAGDRVFISSGYNRGATVIRINGSQPEKVWENKNMRNHFNSCVLWQEHLYGVDESELRCLAFDTGEVKWQYPQFGKGSLMLADGKLIGLSEKGELIIAEATPTAFKPVARAQVLTGKCWTAPALSNGHIYCRNARGDVVCLDVSGK
jgi:outer membrane protein assembly factor BamB